MIDDWDLIEASFLKQYGIRLRQDTDMSWEEFCNLLSGLMHDTPLGNIVSIRSEKDPKIIKNFSKEQKRIRSNWLMRKQNKDKNSKNSKNNMNNYWISIQSNLKKAFS